jgi:hypothetical protein
LYASSSEDNKKNRCWLASGLESLYAIYSPLWLRRPGGKDTDLFYSIVSHFSTQSTHELTESTSIKSILTNGSGKLFDLAAKKSLLLFVPGKEALCNQFIGSTMKKQLSLDIK